MTEHFNKLTPAEDERLAMLAEECAEVIQIVSKIQRHGYDSWHPANPLKTTNRAMLRKEVADIAADGARQEVHMIWNGTARMENE